MADDIITEAHDAVHGPRQAAYGHPHVNFERIAALWNGWLDAKGAGFRFAPEDTADLLILVKMTRFIESPRHRDSHVDIACYAGARARAVGIDE
jgi:hypothetical protein